MEIMRLKTNNRIYSVFSDNINDKNPKIYGYIYENNHFYPLNEDIFKELNKLQIGKNTKKIDTYEIDNITYDVILDLDTNLKHYFLNGKENYNLFINNFEDVIIADEKQTKYNDNSVDKKIKNESVIKRLAVASLSILMLTDLMAVGSYFGQLINDNSTVQTTTISNSIEQVEMATSNAIEIDADKSDYLAELMNNTPKLTPEIISDLIKNNKNISDSDKEILLNSGIIEFASPYISENKEFAAKLYNIILPNFTIVEKDLGDADGKWDPINYIISIDSNVIKSSLLNNGLEQIFDDIYKDVLLHEFVHLLQPNFEYPFLYEPCSEIISNEYLSSNAFIYNAYNVEQKYIKILMEIIGSKSIVEYNFTGSIEPIKKELEQYLSESEIEKLFELFKYNSNYVSYQYLTQEQFENNLKDIEKIYSKLYYNKYHCSMRGNSAINEYLDTDNYSFSKYYFNNCNEHNYDPNLYDLENYKLVKNNCFTACNQTSVYQISEDSINTLSFDTLKQYFYSNQNLSIEEKEMLFNEEFINDYINYTKMYLNDMKSETDNIMLYSNRCEIRSYLEDLRITSDDRRIIGANPSDEFPYRISINDLKNHEIAINENNCKQYASKNNFSYDSVYQKEKLEQFVRVFPENYNHDILTNACTDIILKEYYGIELPKKDSVSLIEEKATKMLIELVGDGPLKYYYFTGSDKLIREKLSLLGDIDDSNIENIMNIFESTIRHEDDISSTKQNLSTILFSLYNIKSDKQYNNEDYDYISENFMDNYYIPETKGYFSASYIEKDKMIHSENYDNIELEINNDLGKSR